MIPSLINKSCYRVMQSLDLGVTAQPATGSCDGTFAFCCLIILKVSSSVQCSGDVDCWNTLHVSF